MVKTPEPLVSFPAGLREGDVVAGRYRLERVIGRGGMGVVVLAYHLELEEKVAVKFLSSDSLSDPEAVSRFDREIRAAARLKNEHIARVYDAGKLPDGGRFMVLEYLEGEDLAARVRRVGPLDPAVAVRYLLQVCAAVLEAHSLGIVHRDIKPANLFVIRRPDSSETVKVLDFGVMKRIIGSPLETEAKRTEPGTIVGTPFYTSPEQLRGSHAVDGRSDIWSLGATLFELLCGVPPFSGKTYPQVIANVLESPPPTIVSLRPSIGEGFDVVVGKCLKKDPSERYESVAEFAVALSEVVDFDPEQQGLLERIVRHHLVSSPLGSPSALITPTHITADGTSSGLGARSRRAGREARRRLLILVAASVVTSAAVFLLGLSLLPPPNGPVARRPSAAAAPIVTEDRATGPESSSPAPTTDATGVPEGSSKYVSAASTTPSASALATGPQATTSTTVPRTAHRAAGKLPTSRPTPNPATAPPPEEPQGPTGVKKNPLLVQPR